MNESARLRLPALIALLAALLVGACRGASGDRPLEGATMGGPFTLTDQHGRQVSDRDFIGRYRLVYFGFTFCPDVCPVDLQTIGAGLRAFEQDEPQRAARVIPIFISVDPRRDTPEVLARYVTAFHPRLIGLTGSEREIARVTRAYGASRILGEPDSNGNYSVDHSRIAVLYGPQGEPIVIVPHDRGPDGVAAELDRWVR